MGTLNSTAISKYVTLKMTDVPSKHVREIKESCYVYAASILLLLYSPFGLKIHLKRLKAY